MAQQTMHAQNGRANLRLRGTDSGKGSDFWPGIQGLEGRDRDVCIHVYGNVLPGRDKGLLRLDCFKSYPATIIATPR